MGAVKKSDVYPERKDVPTWMKRPVKNHKLKMMRGGEGMDWEFRISRCKLVCIEWINKILLYSTGNYIQYPMINHSGK